VGFLVGFLTEYFFFVLKKIGKFYSCRGFFGVLFQIGDHFTHGNLFSWEHEMVPKRFAISFGWKSSDYPVFSFNFLNGTRRQTTSNDGCFANELDYNWKSAWLGCGQNGVWMEAQTGDILATPFGDWQWQLGGLLWINENQSREGGVNRGVENGIWSEKSIQFVKIIIKHITAVSTRNPTS
jgi:hypothetical protein